MDLLEEDELVTPAPVHALAVKAQTVVVPTPPLLLLEDDEIITAPASIAIPPPQLTVQLPTTPKPGVLSSSDKKLSMILEEDDLVQASTIPITDSMLLLTKQDSFIPLSAAEPTMSLRLRRPSSADAIRRSHSFTDPPSANTSSASSSSSIDSKSVAEDESSPPPNGPIHSSSASNVSQVVKGPDSPDVSRTRISKHFSSNNIPIVGAATMKLTPTTSAPSSPGKNIRREVHIVNPNPAASTHAASSKGKISTFFGKMSLSKERMGKLVEQAKEAKGVPITKNAIPAMPVAKFEGIFGIPMRVIMQYSAEQGSQFPSALQKIFDKLDGLNVLMTPNIYLKEPYMPEVFKLRNAFDNGEDVNLRDADAHVVCALLVLYFSLLPEPLIPIECYDMLVRYYNNEKLLRMTMDKLPAPNRNTLHRLLCHMSDVGDCAPYNRVSLAHAIRTFYRFILRPANAFNPDLDTSTQEESNTIYQFLEMLTERRNELLKPREESLNDETVHLKVYFAGALLPDIYAMGEVQLTDTHVHWIPNEQPLTPRATNTYSIPFINISKVELFGALKKESTKALPSTHFVIHFTGTLPPSPRSMVSYRSLSMQSSEHARTLTLGFEDLPTCKFVYTYVQGMLKTQGSRALRAPPFKYDLYGMGLMSLPPSVCRQMKATQELTLGRNSFSTFPNDVMWAENLKILNLEENQIATIPAESVQYMGQRMHTLEVIGLSGNMLTALPPLYPLTRLRSLNISSNRVTSLATDTLLLPNLDTITATHNQLSDLPHSVSPSSPLKTLDLRSNRFKTIPTVISRLKSLTVLNFSHNNISTLPIALFSLNSLTEMKLDNNELAFVSPEIKYMTNLHNNQITKLPIGIGEMRSLMELRVANNKLTTLPTTLLSLKKLVTLEVDGNNLEGIPVEIIRRGREAILDVLKGKMNSLVPCNRYRIVMFGERRSGKTALISQLKRTSSAPPTPVQAAPVFVGLTIHEWTTVMKVVATQEGQKVKEGTFSIWEFTEKDLAHDIHPMFISENCIPVIVWNMADGDERYVGHCLSGVEKRAKLRQSVIVVGTHSDDSSVSKKSVNDTLDKMHKKYKDAFPGLDISYHAMNCLKVESTGIKKLRKQILSIASSYLQASPSVPASYFLFEEYMREMVSVSQSQFVTAKTLRRITKLFGLNAEYQQVRNLFMNLGTLYFFTSEDLTDEIVVLKPETFVNSVFALVKNAAPSSVPSSPASVPSSPAFPPPSPLLLSSSSSSVPSSPAFPSPYGQTSYPVFPPPDNLDGSITGIFPHSRLKEVWGMDTSFFSDVLALLERSGVLFNFYSASTTSLSTSGSVGSKFPMLGRSASHNSFSPSVGYSLIPTHLPPAPRTSDLGALWHPLPEASLCQYGRRYLFDIIPRGVFGILVARTAQFARLVRCWENSAIFVAADSPADSNLASLERVWIRFVPHHRRLDIMSRVPATDVPLLAHLVIRMAEGLLIDCSSVSIPCSHCARYPDPYTFSLPVLWSGDKVVSCQKNPTGPPTPGGDGGGIGGVSIPVTSLLVELAVLQGTNTVISYKDIEMDTLPLRGTQRVHLGSYQNETVVIKLFQSRQSNAVDRKTVLEFCNEVMNMRQLHNEGVVEMHGICFNPLAVVTEYVPLARSGAVTLQQYLLDKKQDADWAKRIDIAISVAETMNYFQSLSPQFCHINLQSSNILLGQKADKMITKLTHFGHSGITPLVFPDNLRQPSVWCAPEINLLGQMNDKSAVYSFGVVLWEIAARAEYLPEITTKEQLIELVNNGEAPNVPAGCPDPLGELIVSCLLRDPNQRPSFSSILDSLRSLQGNIMDWNLQQFRGQALMTAPPLNWGSELVSLDPAMNAIHKLSIGSITQEDSLDTVMRDMRSPTFQGLLQHMKNEFCDEIFQFYQQVTMFKQLNMLANEEQMLAKASAKQIWEVYIAEGAPRQVNIAGQLREALHSIIFGSQPISSSIFEPAEIHIRPLLEDSFRRYKKSLKGFGTVTWERQECGGIVPPPMVGHTVVLHNDKIVVVGGWYNNRWSCDTIYKLHKKNFQWCKHTCSGDIPPPSGGAATATLVGNTILYCCLPNYVYQLFLDTNRWVALKCNIVPASAGFADNLYHIPSPASPLATSKLVTSASSSALTHSNGNQSPRSISASKKGFGFLNSRPRTLSKPTT